MFLYSQLLRYQVKSANDGIKEGGNQWWQGEIEGTAEVHKWMNLWEGGNYGQNCWQLVRKCLMGGRDSFLSDKDSALMVHWRISPKDVTFISLSGIILLAWKQLQRHLLLVTFVSYLYAAPVAETAWWDSSPFMPVSSCTKRSVCAVSGGKRYYLQFGTRPQTRTQITNKCFPHLIFSDKMLFSQHYNFKHCV